MAQRRPTVKRPTAHRLKARKAAAGRLSPRKPGVSKPASGKASPRKSAAHRPLRRKSAVQQSSRRKVSARAATRSRTSIRKTPPRKRAAFTPRARVAKRAPFAKPATAADGAAFRFKPGDRIVTRRDIPKGHCRTPYYLRGRPGVIERCVGHFRNPETLAYGKPGLPKAGLYAVRYDLPKLWRGYTGARADTLVADLFEFWLDPA